MELAPRSKILDHLSVLADATRCRILLVLSRNELTVSEMCAVLQLPQSTVSRHLKILVDAGWILPRREGTHRLYSLAAHDLDGPVRDLWGLARDEVGETATAQQDAVRLESILAQRRSRSQEFFDSTAGRWDHLRDELFGTNFYLRALLGLLDRRWNVADLGCGTGPVVEALAPFVNRVYAVDGSAAMLDTARSRLARFPNVELRRAELEHLPFGDGTLDAATLVLVLHHAAEPSRVLGEIARSLRAGGSLLLVDMLPHDRQEYQQQMGHVWMGFSEDQLGLLLSEAGLELSGLHTLPTDTAARGPNLFAASATRTRTNESKSRPSNRTRNKERA